MFFCFVLISFLIPFVMILFLDKSRFKPSELSQTHRADLWRTLPSTSPGPARACVRRRSARCVAAPECPSPSPSASAGQKHRQKKKKCSERRHGFLFLFFIWFYRLSSFVGFLYLLVPPEVSAPRTSSVVSYHPGVNYCRMFRELHQHGVFMSK